MIGSLLSIIDVVNRKSMLNLIGTSFVSCV